MRYVMNSVEYEVVDKILTESHLDEIIWIQQRETDDGLEDYCYDVEENTDITLKEGLEIIYDAVIFDEMSGQDIYVFKALLRKVGVKVD